MRIYLAAALASLSMAAATSAFAVPQIGIEIFVDGVQVASSPLTAGGISTLTDVTNPYFNVISVTSSGFPITPDPNFGTISINASAAFSSGSHTLTLLATQTGLSGGGFGSLGNTFTYNGLSNPGNVTSAIGSNYVDASNVAYAKTTLIAQSANGGGLATYSSPEIDYSPTPFPLFSETESYSFTFIGQGEAQSSAQITGVPEPVSLALLGSGLIGLGATRRSRAR